MCLESIHAIIIDALACPLECNTHIPQSFLRDYTVPPGFVCASDGFNKNPDVIPLNVVTARPDAFNVCNPFFAFNPSVED